MDFCCRDAHSFIYAIGAVETIAAFGLIAGYRWRLVAAGSSFGIVVVMAGAIASLLWANAATDAVLPAVYVLLLAVLLLRLIRDEGVLKSRSRRTRSL